MLFWSIVAVACLIVAVIACLNIGSDVGHVAGVLAFMLPMLLGVSMALAIATSATWMLILAFVLVAGSVAIDWLIFDSRRTSGPLVALSWIFSALFGIGAVFAFAA